MNAMLDCSDRAAPWIKSRFRLISWMEILKFSADAFYSIGRAAAIMIAALEKSPAKATLSEDSKTNVLKALGNIRGHCAAIGLTMSLKSLERLIGTVDANKTADESAKAWMELDGRISDEIADNLFLFIPKSHVAYYEAKQLFSSKVE